MSTLTEALTATLARRDADELAAAREEQREADAVAVERAFEVDLDIATSDVIRATPLDATPLAERIKALEAATEAQAARLKAYDEMLNLEMVRALRADLAHALGVRDAAMEAETKAEAERDALRAQRDAAVEALAEQAAAWDSLLVEGMAPTVKLFAATCAKSCRATLLLARGTP